MPSMPLSFVFALALAAFASAQATLVVPTTHPTIQAAIVAAQPGDTVLVLPGTWFERIDFLGKAITVRSDAGAATTTIDGGQLGSVVTFATNETLTSVLEGFTITNGLGATVSGGLAPRSAAGGIQCVGASPTIRRCVISGNQGGAGSSVGPSLMAGLGGPGGILASSTALQLVDCEFVNNMGGVGGTGLPWGVYGPVGGRGGAGAAYLQFSAGSPDVTRCRFVGNRGGDGGPPFGGALAGGRGGDGALELDTAVPAHLTQCLVHGNRGGDGGATSGSGGLGGHGGFEITTLLPPVQAFLLRGCVITNNTGGNAGGVTNTRGGNGAGTSGTTVFTAIGSTIAGNVGGTPTPACGGLSVGYTQVPSAVLRNCILWGNTGGADLAVLYGLVANVQASDIGTSTGSVVGSGNLSVNPLFVNLAAGDVHLTVSSPCRHAGIPVVNDTVFDIDGDPRTIGPATDMGADEFEVLAGTREDIALSVTVNGASPPVVSPLPAGAGTVVAITMRSPTGALASQFAVLLVEPWFPPLAPVGPAAYPGLQVPLGASWFAVLPAGVGPGGVTGSVWMPPGLQGIVARIQVVAITTAARNGLFAASAARDLVL